MMVLTASYRMALPALRLPSTLAATCARMSVIASLASALPRPEGGGGGHCVGHCSHGLRTEERPCSRWRRLPHGGLPAASHASTAAGRLPPRPPPPSTRRLTQDAQQLQGPDLEEGVVDAADVVLGGEAALQQAAQDLAQQRHELPACAQQGRGRRGVFSSSGTEQQRQQQHQPLGARARAHRRRLRAAGPAPVLVHDGGLDVADGQHERDAAQQHGVALVVQQLGGLVGKLLHQLGVLLQHAARRREPCAEQGARVRVSKVRWQPMRAHMKLAAGPRAAPSAQQRPS